MTKPIDLGFSEPTRRAIVATGYTNPTPIQREGTPVVIEPKDLIGTGRSAPVAVPLPDRTTRKSTKLRKPGPDKPTDGLMRFLKAGNPVAA